MTGKMIKNDHIKKIIHDIRCGKFKKEDEINIRNSIPVFINSFEQPTYLIETVNWFRNNGFANCYVIDQGSKGPDLLNELNKLKTMNINVIYLDKNVGPRLAIRAAGINVYNVPYIFTDPDLDLPEPPAEFLISYLIYTGYKYRKKKIGLALDISHPELFRDIKFFLNNKTFSIVEWERRFWKYKLEDNIYLADVDTTFYLFNNDVVDFKRYIRNIAFRGPIRSFSNYFMTDIRVAGVGFTAKHRPWYNIDICPSKEWEYYRMRTSDVSTWTKNI